MVLWLNTLKETRKKSIPIFLKNKERMVKSIFGDIQFRFGYSFFGAIMNY
jgi:hypothetical protein